MSVRVWKRDADAAHARLREWAGGLERDETVLAVILFGSLARGEATAVSDADVMLVLEDSPIDFGDRMARFKPIGLGISVEVFPYTLEEIERALRDRFGIVEVALREGRVLFARGDIVETLQDRSRPLLDKLGTLLGNEEA